MGSLHLRRRLSGGASAQELLDFKDDVAAEYSTNAACCRIGARVRAKSCA